MSDLTIPINIPQTGLVDFTFTSPFTFDPNGNFPDDAFGDAGAIRLASVRAKANRDFAVGNASHKIKFKFDAGALAALGVYRNVETLFDDLQDEGIQERILELLQLEIAGADNLMVLRWGYEAGGAANGQVAFSPVKIKFGAAAAASAFSLVMHPVGRDRTIAESIAKVADAWRVPRQVETVDNLAPKTYVVTETAGKLDLSLGAEYGYSYNWVKEDLAVAGLSGDLGLKIEMGISASLNFKTSGRYALALSRESAARRLRAQVFRLKQNGWGFAFDAGLSADLDTSLPPPHVNDFIKGVFNLHGSQVLKDFEKWAFSDKPLADLLGAQLVEYAEDLIRAATGRDVLEQAVEEFRDALKFWHRLPHKINSLLFDFLEKQIDLSELKHFLDRIVEWNQSDDKLIEFVEAQIGKINFFRSPVGKWLNSVAEEGIVSLLADLANEREKLVGFARQTRDVLDGDATEAILRRLQEFINDKLGLEKIENLNPDEWLKKRLADFLGKIPLVEDLNKIKTALLVLQARADELYKKGVEALTKEYNFDLNYSFQKSTSKTALIDITIDFDRAGDERAKTYLKEILDGNFTRLLTGKNPLDGDQAGADLHGVILNQAFLTHEIKRTSHLKINSPFYTGALEQISRSLATARAIESADGQLWLFNLDAESVRKRSGTMSKLAVSAKIYDDAGVRVFEKDSFKARYQYILARKKADNRFVERRLELGVNNYLAAKFPADRRFSHYLSDIDKALDRIENQDLGNLIASLEVALPGDALAAWSELPGNLTDPFYKNMSLVVQKKLRELVPRGFIYDPAEQYEDLSKIYPLFVYAALPTQTQHDGDGIYYWNFGNENLRRNTILSVPTKLNLQTVLNQFLTEIPSSEISNYTNADAILSRVAAPSSAPHNPMVFNFLDLCRLERRVIKGVVGTAKHLQRFRTAANVADKIKHLSKFGAELTETFNEDLGGAYAGKSLRPLGLMLMLEIGKLLDERLETIKPTALLEIMVVKPEIEFDAKKYLDGKFPDSDKLVLEQRIVNAAR